MILLSLFLLALPPILEEPSQLKYTLDNPQIDIFTVEIDSFESEPAFCSGTPGGRLEVEEVLRGDRLTTGLYRFCLASWSEPPLAESIFVLGSRWIVFEYVGVETIKSKTVFLSPPFLRFSAEARSRVDQLAVRDSPLLLPLLYTVLGLSFA